MTISNVDHAFLVLGRLMEISPVVIESLSPVWAYRHRFSFWEKKWKLFCDSCRSISKEKGSCRPVTGSINSGLDVSARGSRDDFRDQEAAVPFRKGGENM
jgi:hypothetical protein